MRKITKRSAAIIGATVVAIGGGAAWAATSWFNGTGTATAASSTVQTVTASATVADNLYPGKNATAAVTVTNPNDYPVKINAAKTPVVTSNTNGCNQGSAKLTLGDVPPNTVIPAKTATGNGTLTANWPTFIRMGGDASPACAGATFSIQFDLEGAVA
ncbi:hypothetical protein ACWEOZ_08980 [Actinoplanes sp. NPDC004185]